MSGTVLSEDIVNLVSQLAELQDRKDELQRRIQLYEEKLGMIREASLALTNEEQELVNQLQVHGFYYGQTSAQPLQPQQFTQSPTSGLPANTQDQLASLLTNLFQQQQPQPAQPQLAQTQPAQHTPLVPTSGQNSFGSSGIYNFPQPSSVISPTSGPAMIRATPKASPTSGPGLSIRRNVGNK